MTSVVVAPRARPPLATSRDTPDVLGRMSVVICAYTEDRWAMIEQAVRSVGSQRSGVSEVILVIDHADQLLRRACQRWPGTQPAPTPVRVLASTGAPGLSGARNTGLAVAQSEMVAFLDDDACAPTRWAESLLEGFVDAGVAGVGGAAHAEVAGGIPAWWPPEFNWVVGCSWHGLPTSTAAIRNVVGCNMAFRRSELLKVGGFREDVGRIGNRPLGCEETDLCIRLHRARPNARVMYLPHASVSHHVAQERLTWGYFRSRCYNEGLSKATVARLNGTSTALASERAYVRHVLPRAVLRDVWDCARGKRGGAGKAAAILLGTAFTVAGYARGRASAGLGSQSGQARTAAPATE